MPDSKILELAAANLRAARMVVAPSAVAVARALGLANANQWTRYETGERKPSLTVLVQFCDLYGLSLDFILRNRTDGLPRDLALKLVAQQALMGLAPAQDREPASPRSDTSASSAPGGLWDNAGSDRTAHKAEA